jgi:hypothetical protein
LHCDLLVDNALIQNTGFIPGLTPGESARKAIAWTAA